MSDVPLTVGELQEALSKYDSDTHVRVDDDGRMLEIVVTEVDGMVVL